MQIRQISKCFWSFSQEESLFVNSKAPSAMYSECFVLIPSKTCSDRPCGGILMLGTSRTRHWNKLYKASEQVVQGIGTSCTRQQNEWWKALRGNHLAPPTCQTVSGAVGLPSRLTAMVDAATASINLNELYKSCVGFWVQIYKNNAYAAIVKTRLQ